MNGIPVGMFVFSVVVGCFGLYTLLYPERAKRMDTRLKYVIKNPTYYFWITRVMALFCLLVPILVLLSFLFPESLGRLR